MNIKQILLKEDEYNLQNEQEHIKIIEEYMR